MLSCCHGSVTAKLLHSCMCWCQDLCFLVLSGQGGGTQKASWLEQLVHYKPSVVCGASFLQYRCVHRFISFDHGNSKFFKVSTQLISTSCFPCA